jgi:hypothetical protein
LIPQAELFSESFLILIAQFEIKKICQADIRTPLEELSPISEPKKECFSQVYNLV